VAFLLIGFVLSSLVPVRRAIRPAGYLELVVL
jgi:hypothetical protein